MIYWRKMMNEELIKMLKYLRLGGLLEHWNDYLALARQKNFSHVRLLKHILQEEYKLKRSNAEAFRLKRARIPEYWVIETYPFNKQPKLSKKRIMSLYDTFEYMEQHQNIIWIGPTGCGKSGLATSFLIHAIKGGYSGRFVTFPDLVAELYTAVADHSEKRVLRKFVSYDCLLIDELGYVEIEPVQVGLFFTLMHKRHRKKSTLVTSNLGFSDWRSILKNDQLSAALIDRLTENSHVINMKNGGSLRPKLKPF